MSLTPPQLLPARAPATVCASVGIIAASMLLVELLVTRLFSALMFYHYSFFAVSIVMTGLTVGSLLSALLLRRATDDSVRQRHLPISALVFVAGSVAATFFFKGFAHWTYSDHWAEGDTTDWLKIGALACAYLPGLTAAGYFLGSAFAWWKQDIARLYAWDLVAAGAAVAVAIYVMRLWQGPAAMLVPALGGTFCAMLLARGFLRGLALASALVILIPVVWAPLRDKPLLSLGVTSSIRGGVESVLYDRWNEHSRVIAHGSMDEPALWMIIDKDAATISLRIPPREEGQPPPLGEEFRQGLVSAYFNIGRNIEDVAVIGVGGGKDVVEAVANQAEIVDGYELNAIFGDLLSDELYEFSGGLIDWPEFNFIHDEGRVGIASSGKKYDLILATLIDTWAATASGGFVLSEASLYTVEGWEEFLDALTEDGLLAMTRWYVPAEPAELQRLVALAATALENKGVERPQDHILILAVGGPDELASAAPDFHFIAAVILSKEPITGADRADLKEFMGRSTQPFTILYPSPDAPPWMEKLIDRRTRDQFIADSPFKITPPTDAAPYFFLMLRPTDLPSLFTEETLGMRAVTYMGVRVLVVMTALSLVFAIGIWVLGSFAFPDRPGEGGQSQKPLLRVMSLYFLSIGFGYILIQLGLLQRLILLLGHPTYAFTVILFSMLLTTGLGAKVSDRFRDDQFGLAWGLVLGGVVLLALAYPLYSIAGTIQSRALRVIVCGIPPAFAGFLLGFCFPIGVRMIQRAGDNAVQRMWAINGAAGVAGSAAAAFIGVLGGSHLVVIVGCVCYGGMLLAGLAAQKQKRAEEPSPART